VVLVQVEQVAGSALAKFEKSWFQGKTAKTTTPRVFYDISRTVGPNWDFFFSF
jgi:hypothetical protein